MKKLFSLFYNLYIVFSIQFGLPRSGLACPPKLFGKDCMSRCHCIGDAICDAMTGRCPIGCENGWDGPACQRENLAYERPTRQKSDRTSLDSTLAVDNDMSTCSRTKAGVPGWWAVTLRRPVSVHSVTIIAETSDDIQGWKVYVGTDFNMLMMTLCTTARVSGNSATLPCDKPVNGSTIMIVNRLKEVTLCDFKIYTCSPLWYGHDCRQLCNCANLTESCDIVTGACASGCATGWIGDDCKTPCRDSYGSDCMYQCGKCVENTPCDHVTGACPQGCQQGWTGIFCNEQCPQDKFGEDCVMTCGHCYGVGSCDIMTGNCVHGCEAGYTGSKCLQECTSGRYGVNCKSICGHCAAGTNCDPKIGVCHNGCASGWQGAFCTQRCAKGFYGEGCLMQCPSCVEGNCDVISGVCMNGCVEGFTGDTCANACPTNSYGVNCSLQCGHCQSGQGRSCDAISGTCQYGCQIGYNGSRCLEVCPGGFYGSGCTKCGMCDQGAACNRFTGACPDDCAPAFFGDLCQKKEKFSDETGPHLQVFLGVMLGIVSIILVSVTLCLVLIWRREQLPEIESKHICFGTDKVSDDESDILDIEVDQETPMVTSGQNGRIMTDETDVMELV